LSKNRIRHIHRGAFSVNEFLQAIRLDGNALKSVDFIFENLTNLVFLNISENLLEIFDYENFPKNLEFLDISKNQINVIKNPNEISQNLKTVNLNFNLLTEISAFVLPRNLENLYLQSNLIDKISPYTFLKKPSLKNVDLKNNKLMHLNENALRISSTRSEDKLPEFNFAGNPLLCDCHLKWLWQENKITINTINRNNIDNPDEFPYLLEEKVHYDDTRNYPSYEAQKMDDSEHVPVINGNYIDSPLKFSLQQMQSIRTQPNISDFDQMTCIFNANSNKILVKQLNPNLFLCKYNNVCMKNCQCCENFSCDCQQKCPDKCSCYHNSNWDVNFVNCSSVNYTKTLPNTIPMDATHLHLDGNNLETIKDFTFIGRRLMRVLYLNNSHLLHITNRTFFGLKNLELLSLRDNELQQLNGDEFNELESVKFLYLQHNRIRHIECKTFIQLNQLRVLSLHGNLLTTLDVTQLPQSLININLIDNAFECDCELIKSIKIHDAIEQKHSLKCHPNHTQHEHYFYIMNETNFCNEKLTLEKIFFFERNLPMLLIAFLTCIFIIVSVFIFYQQIMFYCYQKFNLRFYETPCDKNKIFDGFLIFSMNDENILIDEFLKYFETNENGYKFFLFFHELSSFYEQILKNCENSQKIVLFLSENFLRNEWKKLEYKKIFYEILRAKKRKKLIIIFLDNFENRNSFDAELKLLLKTNFILRWREKLFWEKFKFFLPSINRNLTASQQPQQQQLPNAENFCPNNFHLNNLQSNQPNTQRTISSVHI
jgi:Leucine-rich repeat (LRR) protein